MPTKGFNACQTGVIETLVAVCVVLTHKVTPFARCRACKAFLPRSVIACEHKVPWQEEVVTGSSGDLLQQPEAVHSDSLNLMQCSKGGQHWGSSMNEGVQPIR